MVVHKLRAALGVIGIIGYLGLRVIYVYRHLIAKHEAIALVQINLLDVITLNRRDVALIGIGGMPKLSRIMNAHLIAIHQRSHAADMIDMRMRRYQIINLLYAHRVQRGDDILRRLRMARIQHHDLAIGRGQNHAVARLIIRHLRPKPQIAHGQPACILGGIINLAVARILGKGAGKQHTQQQRQRNQAFFHRWFLPYGKDLL